ncbi:MAG TPA: response regulator [Puia sp.]|nr:response regulator [Puia sp.]
MSSKQKRILLADDDIIDRDFLIEIISQIDRSIKIDSVGNGEQIFQYLAKCPEENLPCLVIMDYNMPYLTCIEVLERMKAENLYDDIPKVIWSAFTDQDLIDSALLAGAANWFPKPSKASELKVIARKMLEFCNVGRQPEKPSRGKTIPEKES